MNKHELYLKNVLQTGAFVCGVCGQVYGKDEDDGIRSLASRSQDQDPSTEHFGLRLLERQLMFKYHPECAHKVIEQEHHEAFARAIVINTARLKKSS